MKHLLTIFALAVLPLCSLPAAERGIADFPTITGSQIDTAADSLLLIDGSAANPQGRKMTFAQLANVSGLFAASSHTHSLSNLTQSGATTGQVPTWNGTAWAAATPATATVDNASVNSAIAANSAATRAALQIYPANYRPFTVSTRCDWGLGSGTLSDGVATSETSRIKLWATEACDNVQVMFGNFISQSTQVANSITIKASIENSSGTIYPLFFNGKRTISLDVLALVASDPQPYLTFSKGDIFYVRTYVSVSSGEKWPRNVAYTGESGAELYTAGSDATDSGTISTSSAQLFGPVHVIGRQLVASPASIAVIGDSITRGYGVSSAEFGPFRAAWDGTTLGNQFGKNRPHSLLSLVGEKASDFADLSKRRHRQTLLRYASIAIDEQGINDIRGGAVSLASFQATQQAKWDMLAAMGMKVYACTLTPNTTSTDSWATTGNQTLVNSTGNTVRTQYNDWIRTLPSPLSGILETADSCESARNSGIWKAGYTGDGLHPNASGFAAYKAVIVASGL